MIAVAALALSTLVALAPKPVRVSCADTTVRIGGHIPGGGYSKEEHANEVVGMSAVTLIDASGHRVHVGYFYKTGSGRYVFASRTTREFGVKNFERVVKLYTDEGFPEDDAEDLVENGPPILMWLPHAASFFTVHHLTVVACG